MTALTLYFTSIASTTLINAGSAGITTGGTQGNGTWGTRPGSAVFVELRKAGGANLTATLPATPSEYGQFLEPARLNLGGNTIPAGTFTCTMNLKYTTTVWTGRLAFQVWKRSSAGVYTQIGSGDEGADTALTLSYVARTASFTIGSPIAMDAGDQIYYEPYFKLSVRPGTSGSIQWYLATTTTGVVTAQLVTPGYALSPVTHTRPIASVTASVVAPTTNSNAITGVSAAVVAVTTTNYVLYGSNVPDSALTTACEMSTNTGGSEVYAETEYAATSNTFGEVWSKGKTAAPSFATLAAMTPPPGNGWVFTPGEGTFDLGNWSGSCAMADPLHGTDDPPHVYLRFWKLPGGVRSSAVLIGSIDNTTRSIPATRTIKTWAATSFSSVAFAASDVLYVDIAYNSTLAINNDAPGIYESTSATAGVVNDMQVTCPLFTFVATTTTYSNALTSVSAALVQTTNDNLTGVSASVQQTNIPRNLTSVSTAVQAINITRSLTSIGASVDEANRRLVASDDYTRADTVSGWGTSTNADGVTNYAWGLDGAGTGVKIASNRGVSGVASTDYTEILDDGVTRAKSEVLVKFSLSVTNANVRAALRHSGGGTTGTDSYRGGYENGAIAIRSRRASVSTVRATTAFALTINQDYWIRFQVITSSGGNPLCNLRCWQDGTSEPNVWGLSWEDTTGNPVPIGNVGLQTHGGITVTSISIGRYQAYSLEVSGVTSARDVSSVSAAVQQVNIPRNLLNISSAVKQLNLTKNISSVSGAVQQLNITKNISSLSVALSQTANKNLTSVTVALQSTTNKLLTSPSVSLVFTGSRSVLTLSAALKALGVSRLVNTVSASLGQGAIPRNITTVSVAVKAVGTPKNLTGVTTALLQENVQKTIVGPTASVSALHARLLTAISVAVQALGLARNLTVVSSVLLQTVNRPVASVSVAVQGGANARNLTGVNVALKATVARNVSSVSTSLLFTGSKLLSTVSTSVAKTTSRPVATVSVALQATSERSLTTVSSAVKALGVARPLGGVNASVGQGGISRNITTVSVAVQKFGNARSVVSPSVALLQAGIPRDVSSVSLAVKALGLPRDVTSLTVATVATLARPVTLVSGSVQATKTRAVTSVSVALLAIYARNLVNVSLAVKALGRHKDITVVSAAIGQGNIIRSMFQVSASLTYIRAYSYVIVRTDRGDVSVQCSRDAITVKAPRDEVTVKEI